MNVLELQRALQARGLYVGALDGIAGKKTRAAIDQALAQEDPPGWIVWTDERRAVAFEQLVYRDLAIEVGKIDGLVGEQTRYAREVYAARSRGDASVETWRDTVKAPAKTAASAAARWPRQAEVSAFYGAPGDASKQVQLKLPFPMRIAWEPSKTVQSVSCHAAVRDAFERIWKRTLDHYGMARLAALRLDLFGGCLSVRKMRGGSNWSMHSWGIAWDIDPDRNQLKWGRALASLDDAPYAPF